MDLTGAQGRRPLALIQSGDALENRERTLNVALSVRDAGWEPVMLVDDFGAAGFFFARGIGCVALGEHRDGPAPEPDFDLDAANVGALALARAERGGKPFGEEEHRAVLAETRRIVHVLDGVRPDALFVWNGFTGVWANALRACKAARALPGGFMERGPAPGAVFLDPQGVNGAATLAEGGETHDVARPLTSPSEVGCSRLRLADLSKSGTPDLDRGEVDAASAAAGEGEQAFPERVRPPHPTLRADLSPLGRGEDPRSTRNVITSPAPPPSALFGAPQAPPRSRRSRTIFVPLQVDDDSNVLLHSERVRSMRSLVLFALALRRELGLGWRVVVRPHPEERAGARLNLPWSPFRRVDGETALERQIDRAGVCLTINSTVGLTAALRGAPVACLGEGLYCRTGFVIEGQNCDVKLLAQQIRTARRRPAAEIAAEAQDFLGRLAEDFLFWKAKPREAALAALARCGVAPGISRTADAPAGDGPVERPGTAYAAAMERLAALKNGAGPVAADFDFGPEDRLFLTYRKNREPLTREALEGRAAAALGREVRLASAHAALGATADLVIRHSKRPAPEPETHALALDEFGYTHARTYRAG